LQACPPFARIALFAGIAKGDSGEGFFIAIWAWRKFTPQWTKTLMGLEVAPLKSGLRANLAAPSAKWAIDKLQEKRYI